MVTSLSPQDKEALARAITHAEQKTSAELVAVIAQASDHYSDFVLLYSLLTGSMAITALWICNSTIVFPILLTIQLGTVALFLLVRPLRHLCIRLVPETFRHNRAAHRAYGEYLRISTHVSAATPIVLFYVSLAERYVHILPSRHVREKIPDASWQDIVHEFTSVLPRKGLQEASVQAVERITALLAPSFPPTGESHHFHHPVIEMDRNN